MLDNKNFYELDELRKDVFQNKVSRAHIYNMVKKGNIPAVKIGRRLLVPAYYVDRLLGAPHGA